MIKNVKITVKNRAEHATTLQRQCGHIFKPQTCWLLQYYYIRCGFSISKFSISCCPLSSITLSRCRCREAKNSRAQLWFKIGLAKFGTFVQVLKLLPYT